MRVLWRELLSKEILVLKKKIRSGHVLKNSAPNKAILLSCFGYLLVVFFLIVFIQFIT